MDIGGGQGMLLSAILKNNPKLQGILFDLPHAIQSAISSESCKFKGQ